MRTRKWCSCILHSSCMCFSLGSLSPTLFLCLFVRGRLCFSPTALFIWNKVVKPCKEIMMISPENLQDLLIKCKLLSARTKGGWGIMMFVVMASNSSQGEALVICPRRHDLGSPWQIIYNSYCDYQLIEENLEWLIKLLCFNCWESSEDKYTWDSGS